MRTAWKRLCSRGVKPAVLAAYLLVVGVFIGAFAQFYIPGKGFSYLISFGGKQPHPPIEELKDLDFYVQADSEGYDAQYYVQIAMDPALKDPHLVDAVDNLAYRARRILISWSSYAMGWGQPGAIMHAYVLQNALCWLLLAGVMLWWFPPTSWTHWLRWTGVLFSFGMCVSVRNSLVDGPSLLLIALGVMLLERGRPWWSTAVLAISGLGKETNLLGAAALVKLDDLKSPRRWPVLILRGVLVVVPLALWLIYIERTVGPAADLGARNFDWPLMAFSRKWAQVWSELLMPQSWSLGILRCGPLWSFLMMAALTVQCLFFVLRPAGKQPWWRVGASFAVLLVVLGDAVWEGYPGAASRVLLPMQLAFNVLVPSGRAWLPVLLLGNLTLLNAPAALQPPLGDGYKLDASESVIVSPESGRLRVVFGNEWHEPERRREHYWRWCRSSSDVTIVNPHAYELEADMDFILSALEKREVRIVDASGTELWRGEIEDAVTRVNLARLRLHPGSNRLAFLTDDSVSKVRKDQRPLAFCLKDWVIHLRVAPQAGYILTGSKEAIGTDKFPGVSVEFAQGWHDAERSEETYWRWSKDSAELVIINRHAAPLIARLDMVLNAISKRTVTLTSGAGVVLWQGEVSSKHSQRAEIVAMTLTPGANSIQFTSNLPPSGADDDTRLLDISLKNLVIDVQR